MLNNKGFDLWADGYDKTVGISDEENIYPFAGYKKVLGFIFQTIMRAENAVVLDIAYNEWKELDGKTLKNVNKYTEWRGKGILCLASRFYEDID